MSITTARGIKYHTLVVVDTETGEVSFGYRDRKGTLWTSPTRETEHDSALVAVAQKHMAKRQGEMMLNPQPETHEARLKVAEVVGCGDLEVVCTTCWSDEGEPCTDEVKPRPWQIAPGGEAVR